MPKRISREDAHSSSDSLLVNNSANLNIALKETANQHQEDMKQHRTHEENNIENDEGNQLDEKLVDYQCCYQS